MVKREAHEPTRAHRNLDGVDGSRSSHVVMARRMITQLRGYRIYLAALYSPKSNGVSSMNDLDVVGL